MLKGGGWKEKEKLKSLNRWGTKNKIKLDFDTGHQQLT